MRLISPPLVVIICLGLFLSTLDTGIVNIALEPLTKAFSVSLEQTGLTVTIYLLCMISALLPAGWIGDRWGQQRSMAAGFFLFALSSLFAGLSINLVQLVIARAAQGIAAALLQANALGLAGSRPKSERLKLSTMMTLAISLGPILGPSLGGIILELWDWRGMFLINIPFCAVGLFITLKQPKMTSTSEKTNFDLVGITLLIMVLTTLSIAIYHRNLGLSPWMGGSIALISTIGLVVFIFHQSFKKDPLIPVRLFFTMHAIRILSGTTVFGFTAGVLFAMSPILLINNTGLSYQQVGLVCTGAPIGLAMSIIVRRRITQEISDIGAMRLGMGVMTLALFALALFDKNIRSEVYFILSIFYGVGGGWFQISNMNASMDLAPNAQSVSGGLLRLMQNLGIAIGAASTLFLIVNFNQWFEWVGSGYGLSWLICAFLTSLSFLLLFFGNRKLG